MDTMDSKDQPVVRVLLLASPQVQLVQQSVSACLAREGRPYELIFSDDCWRDGTYEAVLAAVKDCRGPRHLEARQNRRNLGIGLRYNELFSEAKGELLITATEEDISAPSRVRKLVKDLDATQHKVDLLASHVFDLDAASLTHRLIKVDRP